MWSPVSGLFQLASIRWVHQYCYKQHHPLLELSRITNENVPFSLWIHQLINTDVTSLPWWLWIILQWTCSYRWHLEILMLFCSVLAGCCWCSSQIQLYNLWRMKQFSKAWREAQRPLLTHSLAYLLICSKYHQWINYLADLFPRLILLTYKLKVEYMTYFQDWFLFQ